MQVKVSHENTILKKRKILTKAVQRAAELLDISRKELVFILGQSEPTFSRIFKDNAIKGLFDPTSKEGQLAILFVRLFKNLDVLFGGNSEQAKKWLRSHNYHLSDSPIHLIQSIEGFVVVIQYLDSMRGKN